MKRLTLIAAALALTGCITFNKAGVSPSVKAEDQYQCQVEAYAAANGSSLMISTVFRHCMLERGYN